MDSRVGSRTPTRSQVRKPKERASGGAVRGYADGGSVDDDLPDFGDPLIGDGGEFSRGTGLGNKAAGTQPNFLRYANGEVRTIDRGQVVSTVVVALKATIRGLKFLRKKFQKNISRMG